MTFEKPIIQSQEAEPEGIKKLGDLTYKIFEMGAKGGEKTKSALRVLTLLVALSPTLNGTAEAGWFGWGKKEPPKETIMSDEEFKESVEKHKQILEILQKGVESGAVAPPDFNIEDLEKKINKIPSAAETVGVTKKSEKQTEFTKESAPDLFNKIRDFKEELREEANFNPKAGEAYSLEAREYFQKAGDLELRFMGYFPTIGAQKGNQKDFQRLEQEFQKLQDGWFKIITSLDYKKEETKLDDKLAVGWIEFNKKQRAKEENKERVTYQYLLWNELFNSPHFMCEATIIVPRLRLTEQDRIVIYEMRRTREVNVPQLFRTIGRYDSAFANQWLTFGNMLDQGLDFFGNKLSTERLKRARANYTKSVYYIVDDLCR